MAHRSLDEQTSRSLRHKLKRLSNLKRRDPLGTSTLCDFISVMILCICLTALRGTPGRLVTDECASELQLTMLTLTDFELAGRSLVHRLY